MTNIDDNNREQYTQNDLHVFEVGKESWELLKKTFDRWVEVGDVYQLGSKLCALRVGAVWPHPKGRAYNERFGKWLTSGGGHEKGEWIKELAGDARSALRSHLGKMMDNLQEIKEWRKTLTDRERAEWAGPQSVLQHWGSYNREIAAGTRQPPKTGGGLKEAVMKLEKENEELKAELKKANASRVLGSKTSAETMAKKIMQTHPGLADLSTTQYDDLVKKLRGLRLSTGVKAAAAMDDE